VHAPKVCRLRLVRIDAGKRRQMPRRNPFGICESLNVGSVTFS